VNKTFIHHDIPSLVQINNDGHRLYQTPTGEKYPSVTTIMSWYNYENIQKWRQRVGAEEANKVSARASKRGTATHTLCEHYLLGTPKQPDMFEITANVHFAHLKKIVNLFVAG
jgi:genome maintenance exonuclease 1